MKRLMYLTRKRQSRYISSVHLFDSMVDSNWQIGELSFANSEVDLSIIMNDFVQVALQNSTFHGGFSGIHDIAPALLAFLDEGSENGAISVLGNIFRLPRDQLNIESQRRIWRDFRRTAGITETII